MIGLILLFLAGAYVGWNIGANDAGNCIGTTVGSGLLSYRKAVALVCGFAVLGGLLQGSQVMETMGSGIIQGLLPRYAILTALLSAGAFVTLATILRIPVSTSQAIVGGVAGVGLAAGLDIQTAKIVDIVQVWVICPPLVGVMAVLLLLAARWLLRRLNPGSFWQRLPYALLILSSCYISFSLGANHVGTAMGPIAGVGIAPIWLSLIGGLALASGALMLGRRVTETVGHGITQLDAVSAFSAQLSAALAVHFFSILGIPVSTSQAVVGAVIGVGLLHGIRTVRLRKIRGIALGWVATPTAAGILSFGIYKVILLIGD